MIPDFKTYMNESVWSDIHKRSNGDKVRREDDVNLMNVDEFFDYLKCHYKGKRFEIEKKNDNGRDEITVPVCKTMYWGGSFCICLDYIDGRKRITISSDLKRERPEIYYKFKELYSLSEVIKNRKKHCFLKISPVDGETSQKFFVDILDMLTSIDDEDNIIELEKI